MNLRHAGALALVGWYLMIPPTRGAPAEILYHAPLSRWEVSDQYDGKVECENSLKEIVKNAQHNSDQCTNGDCAVTVAQLAGGRCMASDDPRLKNNASVKSSK
jgi:hypothetical protein